MILSTCIVLLATGCHAAIVFTIPLTGGMSGYLGARGEIPSVHQNFSYSLSISGQTGASASLDYGAFNRTEAPVTRSFIGGNFGAFSLMLTNGINDDLRIPLPPTNLMVFPTTMGEGIEHYWFSNNDNTATLPDLAGYMLSDIQFTLERWDFDFNTPNDSYPLPWFESILEARLDFYGTTIPEPCSMGFVAALLLIKTSQRRR